MHKNIDGIHLLYIVSKMLISPEIARAENVIKSKICSLYCRSVVHGIEIKTPIFVYICSTDSHSRKIVYNSVYYTDVLFLYFYYKRRTLNRGSYCIIRLSKSNTIFYTIIFGEH